MNLVLAIDTSGGTQVALVPDGVPAVVLMRPDPRGHAEYTSVMIERVMRQAGRRISELTAVAVGTGPAPFTGLRVGLVTARTVARAAGVPLYGVASTEAWAGSAFAAAPQLTQVRVVTDARRREVYTARYDRSDQAPGLVEVEEPQVLKPADLAPTLQADRAAGIAIVGPGCIPTCSGRPRRSSSTRPFWHGSRWPRRPSAPTSTPNLGTCAGRISTASPGARHDLHRSGAGASRA